MAISRTHTWIAGEVLTASDLNAEFNSILNNAADLVSPFTKAISMGGFAFNLDAANTIAFTAMTSGVTLTGGTLREPTQDTITAFATGGQTNATALTVGTKFHRVSVCATAGDSYKLPASTAGQCHYVRNDGAAAAQAFGAGTDTINGVATATGIPHPVGVGIWFACTTAGNWTTGPLVAVSGNFPVTLTATASTNVTLPTTGTLATLAGTEALSNKTIGNTNTVTIKDTLFTLQDDGDATKQWQYQLSGLTTGTTRVGTPQDQNFTIGSVARGHIAGLALSTAGSSATMTVAAGQATDSTNVMMMNLASTLNKTTSAWAVGDAQGGLDTGSIANSTWYHFYEIMRPDTGVVDVLISLSASAPTMPANYTLKRRIGSGKTDGSAHWTAFVQDGDYYRWSLNVTDVNTTNPGTAAISSTLTVPTGVNVQALMTIGLVTGAGTSTNLYVSDLAATDEAPGGGALASIFCPASSDANAGPLTVRTNTSSQIRYRAGASDANVVVQIRTIGWYDRRGRDS